MLLPLETPLVPVLSANGPPQHAITGVDPSHVHVHRFLETFCTKRCELAA